MEEWSEMIRGGQLDAMLSELLALHYDPTYLRASTGHYEQLDSAKHVTLGDLSEDALQKVAQSL